MTKTRKQIKDEKIKAFESVVSEYEGALLRYVARIVHDYNMAQDVIQETFIKLFEKWKDELVISPKLSSWLYRVAHNCAVDYLRKETRHFHLHQRHSEESEHSIPPNRGKGFKISESAERAVTILRQLSLREQQLVVLKVYEEKSYREISEITGLTVSNVGYILHHAMKKMAAEFKKAKAI
ncbi:RNA polymerase sigma factor [Verrucomicrobiota bacterium]